MLLIATNHGVIEVIRLKFLVAARLPPSPILIILIIFHMCQLPLFFFFINNKITET